MNLANSIPVFKLYGESWHWPTPDLLHCESIQSRSSLYDWSIRAHQHTDLVQILYIQQGQGEIEIEGVRQPFTDACVQIMPALCVHGFRFSPGTQGYSLSLAAPLVAKFEQQFGRPLQVLSRAVRVPVGDAGAQIHTLFQTLQQEYQADNDARDMMLHSLLSALMVWLNRQTSGPDNQYRDNQRFFTPHFIADMSKDNAAQRPCQEAHRISGKCGQRTD